MWRYEAGRTSDSRSISGGVRKPLPLSERVAATMLLADGEHDMETDDMVMLLVMRGLIEPCEKGERPSAWSTFRAYDNACFPMMNLMIIGKCNFNCLHCFNAADNAALMTEWSFEDLCSLLDQARGCGITSFQFLLADGPYVRAANMTVRDLGNSECGTCRHLGYCGGGCRALGLLYSGKGEIAGLTCKDVTKCRFFEDGWYQKIVQALPGWTNLSDIGAWGNPGVVADDRIVL